MFVVFEGIDGSGKTTISNRVAERLVQSGLSVKHLRAGGEFASLVTQAIRELGRDARNFELEKTAEFLLYLARDVQLLHQILTPALQTHDIVIADRSYYTAQVLGQFGRHLSPEWIDPILKLTTAQFKPDLVVLVDVDPKLARARRKTSKLIAADRRPPSRKGLGGVGLQYRLQRGYLQLAESEPERWAVLANQGTLEESIDLTTRLILDARANGAPAALKGFRQQATVRAPTKAVPTPQAALEELLHWVDAHSLHEPHVAAYMLGGLFGEGVDPRRSALAQRAPEAVLAAAAGLDDPVSWQLREQFSTKLPRFVAQTVNGFEFAHSKARALRESLLTTAPEEVMRSFSGLNDEGVWTLRERLFAQFPAAVIGSLGRVAGERGWKLRDEWLRQQGALNRDYETARVGLRSVAWLDDEKAWGWREGALDIAPIAALESLNGVNDEKSWQWRNRFLHYAPKVVMATVRRMTQPLAWQMRHAVVADCKEAIDSVSAMDDAEAWQLREESRDLWPSTVVKSLGPLADGAKGQALLLRQLERHPGNLSLLQHAAAIALGAHRIAPLDDEVAAPA